MPQHLLVKLYDRPSTSPEEDVLLASGIEVRRALPIDKHRVMRSMADLCYYDKDFDQFQLHFARVDGRWRVFFATAEMC